jgi:hypothetical protein
MTTQRRSPLAVPTTCPVTNRAAERVCRRQPEPPQHGMEAERNGLGQELPAARRLVAGACQEHDQLPAPVTGRTDQGQARVARAARTRGEPGRRHLVRGDVSGCPGVRRSSCRSRRSGRRTRLRRRGAPGDERARQDNGREQGGGHDAGAARRQTLELTRQMLTAQRGRRRLRRAIGERQANCALLCWRCPGRPAVRRPR